MYSDILFPTDGSKGADHALECARDLAEKYGARVHVMHVIDTSHVHMGLGDDPDKESHPGMVGHPEGVDAGMGGRRETLEQVREQAQAQGEEIVEQTITQFNDIETEGVVEAGEPHNAILDYAEDNADIIVMGTHGRQGMERYLLGSVTEKVVRMADVPVLSVRETPET